MVASRTARTPIVRKMDFDLSDVPRWWMGGSATFTHALNGVNLLFPAGERFFVRSVQHYLPRLDDPALRARVAGFIGQEARHGLEHEEAARLLERQGYEVASFLERYERLAFRRLEASSSPVMCLSSTVALEHLTAAMAHVALTRDHLAHAHPAMADLFRWHACEEIEHKSVAFDVLAQVDGRWSVRATGAFFAYGLLLGCWTAATRHLLAQESLDRSERRAHRARARALGQDRSYLRHALRDYLRRDFHPDDLDDYPLAERWLADVARRRAIAPPASGTAPRRAHPGPSTGP